MYHLLVGMDTGGIVFSGVARRLVSTLRLDMASIDLLVRTFPIFKLLNTIALFLIRSSITI